MLKTQISSKFPNGFCCCCCCGTRPAPTHTLMTHDSITGCGPCCCCCLCCCGGRGCGGRNMSVCVSFCRRLANITKRLLMYMAYIYIYFRYRIRYAIFDFEFEFVCLMIDSFPQRAQRMKRRRGVSFLYNS